MIKPAFDPVLKTVTGVLVNVSLLIGTITLLAPSTRAQTICSTGTEQASFETPSYQLTICQENNALFLVSQQKSGDQQMLRMPAFYNPETEVFGGVRTVPNPGAAYSYDLNPAITTVYYLQGDRLFVLENGRLAVNEPITQLPSR